MFIWCPLSTKQFNCSEVMSPTPSPLNYKPFLHFHYVANNIPYDFVNLVKMEETDMKESEIPNNVLQFGSLTEKIRKTYADKNSDYGDSFHNSVQKYGLIAALTRMSDKFGRMETLILNRKDQKVKNESLKDTLLDLATYAIMTAMEVGNGD